MVTVFDYFKFDFIFFPSCTAGGGGFKTRMPPQRLIQAFFLDKISEVFGGQASGKLSFLRNFSVFFLKMAQFFEKFLSFYGNFFMLPSIFSKNVNFLSKIIEKLSISTKKLENFNFFTLLKTRKQSIFPLFF